MKTTFTTSELINGVATYNADPFCIEDEDMAQEIINTIDEFGCSPVADDEMDDAKAKLDINPDDDSWSIYEAGNECLFAVHKREHEITDVELTKGNYNRGDVLTYKADGEWVEVTGEFWVKDGILHHTHIFDDDEELEVTINY